MRWGKKKSVEKLTRAREKCSALGIFMRNSQQSVKQPQYWGGGRLVLAEREHGGTAFVLRRGKAANPKREAERQELAKGGTFKGLFILLSIQQSKNAIESST